MPLDEPRAADDQQPAGAVSPRPLHDRPPRNLIPLIAVGATVASLIWMFSMTGHGGEQAVALEPGPGEPLPDFSLEAIDGGALSSQELAGKVVVLDLWGTWCAPCLTELPGYNALHEEFRHRGVEVVGVALRSGDAAAIRAFTAPERYPVSYPVVLGDKQFESDFGPVWGLPVTLLIDRQWRVRKTWLGATAGKHEALRVGIEQLLAEPAAR